MVVYIPCMYCGTEYTETWLWYVCDKCGYRICSSCIGKHEGPYGNHSRKCSQCTFGYFQGPKRLK